MLTLFVVAVVWFAGDCSNTSAIVLGVLFALETVTVFIAIVIFVIVKMCK